MPVEARAYPRPLPNPDWLGKLQHQDIRFVVARHHVGDQTDLRLALNQDCQGARGDDSRLDPKQAVDVIE